MVNKTIDKKFTEKGMKQSSKSYTVEVAPEKTMTMGQYMNPNTGEYECVKNL